MPTTEWSFVLDRKNMNREIKKIRESLKQKQMEILQGLTNQKVKIFFRDLSPKHNKLDIEGIIDKVEGTLIKLKEVNPPRFVKLGLDRIGINQIYTIEKI